MRRLQPRLAVWGTVTLLALGLCFWAQAWTLSM